MPLSAIFQSYHGGKFYWWKTIESPEKHIDLPEVPHKMNHMMCLYCLVMGSNQT